MFRVTPPFWLLNCNVEPFCTISVPELTELAFKPNPPLTRKEALLVSSQVPVLINLRPYGPVSLFPPTVNWYVTVELFWTRLPRLLKVMLAAAPPSCMKNCDPGPMSTVPLRAMQ